MGLPVLRDNYVRPCMMLHPCFRLPIFSSATSNPSRRVLSPSEAVLLGAEAAAVGSLPLESVVLGLLLINPP